MKIALCFAVSVLLILSGCGAIQPEVRVVPVEKKVPIKVPCIPRAVAKPEWKRGSINPDTATSDQKMAAMEAELLQRETYEGLLEAAILECKK